tara:strand:+ start:1491 stop:1652 length:162 start_codon:yes stop_codon:yes gene_type:complete
MYRVIFDDNVIICEDLEAARVAASEFRETFDNVAIVPATPTNLDSLEEVEVEC